MADGWIWLHYIVPIRYGVAGLVTPAFHCPDDIPTSEMSNGEPGPCSTVSVVRNGAVQAGVRKSDFIDDFMGFTYDDIGFYIGILVLYAAAFALAKTILLRYVRHQSR